MWDDWVFALSPTGARWVNIIIIIKIINNLHRMRSVLKTLHGFTEKVIAERKKELEEKRADDQDEEVMRMRVILILMPRGGVKKWWNSIH